MDVAVALRLRLRHIGAEQRELAEQAGVSEAYISQLLSGKKAPPAPRRTEIYGFGGGPAGLIWPWFTYGSRAVLVAEKPAGFGTWVVLEPQGRESTFPVGVAADREGNIHTLYERSRGGMGGVISYRYACIGADVF